VRTNRAIHNPYLRALAAREIVGWRAVYAKSETMTRFTLIAKIGALIGMAGRIDLHLRRYPAAVVAGNTAPLADYAGGFAGHG
jgi:hypothetical protein